MNDYYSGRSSPGGAFRSVSSTDRKASRYQETAGSRRHGPLTISRASISVTRLIRRVVDLAGAHKRGALYSSRRAPCEKPTGRGVSRHAWGGRVHRRLRSEPLRDLFMNNPG